MRKRRMNPLAIFDMRDVRCWIVGAEDSPPWTERNARADTGTRNEITLRIVPGSSLCYSPLLRTVDLAQLLISLVFLASFPSLRAQMQSEAERGGAPRFSLSVPRQSRR
jgi:hypothetical protein